MKNISNNQFECTFHFDNLTEIESNTLTECVISIHENSIHENSIKFNLYETAGIISPLDIIVKLYRDSLLGDINIKVYNKEGVVLYILSFKDCHIESLGNLVDFNYDTDVSNKTVIVNFSKEKLFYKSANIEKTEIFM